MDRGTFNSIYEVNLAYPTGGVRGDYVTIDGQRYYWWPEAHKWTLDGTTDVDIDETEEGMALLLAKLNEYIALANEAIARADGIGQSSSHALGYFPSLESLMQQYPNPTIGDWAIVEVTTDGTTSSVVYNCETAGEWSEGASFSVTLGAPLDKINNLGNPSSSGVYGFQWNGTGYSWVPASSGGGGASLNTFLSNVNTKITTNPSSTGAYTLQYNGSGNYVLKTLSESLTAVGVTGAISTLQGYFTNGVANNAARLTAVSKTAWGQTYWTSGGVPTNISGNMSNVGNILMSGYLKIGNYYLISKENGLCVASNSTGTGNANFYATGGVSALGYSSGGSGGGGGEEGAQLFEPLSSINEAGLGEPEEEGVTLVWKDGEWGYGTTGIVKSVGVTPASASNLTVSGSTINESHPEGVFSIGVANGYSIPSDEKQIEWDDAYDIRHMHTDLAALNTINTSKVAAWDTVTGYFTSSGEAKKLRLTTPVKLWGRNFDGSSNVDGTIEDATCVEFTKIDSAAGHGGHIDFHHNGFKVNGQNVDFTTRIIESPANAISIVARSKDSSNALRSAGLEVGAPYTGSYIRIGNYYLTATSNGLCVSASANGTGSANLYATGGVSALGAGSSGGGGGVSLESPLDKINNIGDPEESGVTLVWDGSSWGYGTTGISSDDVSDMIGTALENYAYISSGTIHIGDSQITPLTSSAISDMATQSDIADTKSWVNNQGFLTQHQSVLGKFWGQEWSNTQTVQGNLKAGNNGGTISDFHAIELNNKNSVGGNIHCGGFIDFHYDGIGEDFTSRIMETELGVISIAARNDSGNMTPSALKIGTGVYGASYLQVGNDTAINANRSYVQIGNVRLTYDPDHNALKVSAPNGNAANLYAVGGISALGFQSGSIDSLDAFTIGSLTVTQSLTLSDGKSIVTASPNGNLIIGASGTGTGKIKFVREICSFSGSSTPNWSISASGTALFNGEVTVGNNLTLTGDARIFAKRYYLDSQRFIYMVDNKLYFYNGTANKEIAFVS